MRRVMRDRQPQATAVVVRHLSGVQFSAVQFENLEIILYL